MRRVDPDTWTPPPLDTWAPGARVPGALGGSLLLERPEHAAFRARIDAFVARPGPLGFEVGFDHGERMLALANARPDLNVLGCEIRRKHVEEVAAVAPENLLAVRADARTLLATCLPAGRLAFACVLFPTPSTRAEHLLLTPPLVALLARALGVGTLSVATDVPGMARHVEALLDGWPDAEPPPEGPRGTRREWLCLRDGRPVWRFHRRPPDDQRGL